MEPYLHGARPFGWKSLVVGIPNVYARPMVAPSDGSGVISCQAGDANTLEVDRVSLGLGRPYIATAICDIHLASARSGLPDGTANG